MHGVHFERRNRLFRICKGQAEVLNQERRFGIRHLSLCAMPEAAEPAGTESIQVSLCGDGSRVLGTAADLLQLAIHFYTRRQCRHTPRAALALYTQLAALRRSPSVQLPAREDHGGVILSGSGFHSIPDIGHQLRHQSASPSFFLRSMAAELSTTIPPPRPDILHAFTAACFHDHYAMLEATSKDCDFQLFVDEDLLWILPILLVTEAQLSIFIGSPDPDLISANQYAGAHSTTRNLLSGRFKLFLCLLPSNVLCFGALLGILQCQLALSLAVLIS
mmetsp:Transcript_156377/g.291843  ORF Transcript_156377/g.291843 Transcript_156377/m.291843 type:complete len:276 (-) Transcript_156377:1697-2524(-)